MLQTLQDSAFSTWLLGSGSIWAFPTVLMLHTFGMMLLVGPSAVLDLRVLGAARAVPLGSLRVLFPVMWTGFWVSLVTGTMLFCADATTKAAMPLFFIKMALVVAAVCIVVFVRREVYPSGTDAAAVTPAARRLAVASLFVWMLTVTAGRLLGYAG